MLRAIQLLLIGALAFAPLTVLGQSYHSGYQLYVSGDFSGAELAFKRALNYAKTVPEKTRLYKMLGISQYMLGKRIESASSFKQAKQLDPNLLISANEVLDESVVPFFDSIAVASSDTPSAPKPPPRATNPGYVPASPATQAVIPTGLIVNVNVRGASIVLDGTKRMASGTKVVLQPGIHELRVRAAGYKGVVQPVTIKRGITNVFNVTLVRERTRLPEKVVTSNKKKPEKGESASKSKSSLSKKKKKRKVKKRKVGVPAGRVSWVTFLPFGVGQFANNDTVYGIGFAVGQALGLGLGIAKVIEGNKIVEETNAELTNREAFARSITDPDEQDEYFKSQIEQYKADQDARAADAYNQGNIGFAVFGALWVAGAAHAYFSTKSASKSKKVRRSTSVLSPADTRYDVLVRPSIHRGSRPLDLGLKLSLHF